MIQQEVYKLDLHLKIFVQFFFYFSCITDKGMIIVQVYVNDILFGATNESLCKEFSDIMCKKFEMSMIGDLTFFLGFQVKQKKNDIFICQCKFVK